MLSSYVYVFSYFVGLELIKKNLNLNILANTSFLKLYSQVTEFRISTYFFRDTTEPTIDPYYIWGNIQGTKDTTVKKTKKEILVIMEITSSLFWEKKVWFLYLFRTSSLHNFSITAIFHFLGNINVLYKFSFLSYL